MSDWTISCRVTKEQLQLLLEKIKELSKLNSGKDDNVTCIIDTENILLYSHVGKTINDISAFKNFILKTDEYMVFKSMLKSPLQLIINDCKKFVRKLNNYLSFESDINLTFQVDEDSNFVNSILFNNNKLKIRVIGGDPFILGNINIDTITHITDTSSSKFMFSVNSIDFNRIKKLLQVDSSNDVLNIKINNGEVTIGENKWELDVDKIDSDYNRVITFNKKYFGSISNEDSIIINVFDNHILLNSHDSNLMIVLEFSA
jgi:hypothetical protein